MTTRLSRRCALLAFAMLCLTLVFSGPAFASGAGDFVQRMGDKALTSLTAKDLPAAERQARVRTLLSNNFDVGTIARFALGTYWKEATAAQRTEYMRLFENMIVKTYAQRFSEYSGQTFKVGDSISASTKDTVVNSQIIQKDGPPVNVQWRVRNNGGNLKVIDVIVENVSMSVTQRSDFAAVIQGGGGKIDALLKSLRERSAEKKK
jgi:phospholipid transport system substrate-binding protein